MKKAHIETDKGEIVVELFEDDAPGTVENFVGLVTGTKEWTDPKTGEKMKGKPLYDGLRFHRCRRRKMPSRNSSLTRVSSTESKKAAYSKNSTSKDSTIFVHHEEREPYKEIFDG